MGRYNGMAKPNGPIGTHNMSLYVEDIVFNPDLHVKILGAPVDNQLSLSQHISRGRTKPIKAMQSSPIYQITRIINCTPQYHVLYNYTLIT